jgi:uncharacterized phage protein (TIGR01671 family)
MTEKREIKFRVKIFDDDTKNDWVYSDRHGLVDFWFGIRAGRYDEETICQFIGLTDENRKEIYENDIVAEDPEGKNQVGVVKIGRGYITVGEYFHNYYGVYIERDNDWLLDDWLDDLLEHKLYVVGNIFDNSELLTKE